MTPLSRQRQARLREMYGFDFPDDFFRFWEFVNRLQPLDPLNALRETLGVWLVGPFEVLSGRFDGRTPRLSPLLHWRYYLDPPEFFTVLLADVDKLHWGYYLDDPAAGGGCVASYYANDAFELSTDGDDLFAAVRLHLELTCRDGDSDAEGEQRDALRRALQRYATADRPETGEAYFDQYQGAAARGGRVIASTPEGMGIVAPRELYRPPLMPDKKLRSYLRKLKDPADVVEEARQALRDGFPATALKLGKELWPSPGKRKTVYAHELLDAAYAALGRNVLQKVLHAHRTHRDLPTVDILALEEGETEGDPRWN